MHTLLLSKLIKYISPVLRTYMLLALVVGGIVNIRYTNISHTTKSVFWNCEWMWEQFFFWCVCDS